MLGWSARERRATDGFFELGTAADLRAKLRREFARLEANHLDSDSLFNFVATAGTLLDWAHPGEAGRVERDRLKRAHPELGVCSHLNNQAKHFRIERRGNDSVAATVQEVHRVGMSLLTVLPRLTEVTVDVPGRMIVELRGPAAAGLGSTILALDLARQVLAFWDAYPLDEAPPAGR